MRRKSIGALTVFVSLFPFAAPAETWRNHFDADAAARPPAFFDAVVLGSPGTAYWMVIADRNPPSSPNQLTQTMKNRPQGSIAAALRRSAALQDGSLAVALKKLPSRAGLVFRMSGEKDFLVLLLDGSTGEARLTAYRAGAPTELARGNGVLDREWGILRVALSGKAVTATWNEKELLRGEDASPGAGRAGVATEGPGVASFDELVIESAGP